MVVMALQSRMMHCSYLRMLGEEINHLQGVLHMTLHTQTQGLYTLQQYEGIERRDGGTGITQDDGTDAGDISRSTYGVGKHDAMIRGIRLGERGELVVLLPVELTTIDDDTTQT